MNIMFLILSVASLLVLTINNPATIFTTMINGAQGAIELAVKLLAIYSVWLSVLKMMEKTKVDRMIAKALHPITKRLFKGESEEAYVAIAVNFSANILGMGSVATPAGMKAMNLMHKGGEKATPNMILLFVLAATSLQLIPATVIALRAAAGSANAADVFIPTLIASGTSTVVAVILCKVLGAAKAKEKAKGKRDKIKLHLNRTAQ